MGECVFSLIQLRTCASTSAGCDILSCLFMGVESERLEKDNVVSRTSDIRGLVSASYVKISVGVPFLGLLRELSSTHDVF